MNTAVNVSLSTAIQLYSCTFTIVYIFCHHYRNEATSLHVTNAWHTADLGPKIHHMNQRLHWLLLCRRTSKNGNKNMSIWALSIKATKKSKTTQKHYQNIARGITSKCQHIIEITIICSATHEQKSFDNSVAAKTVKQTRLQLPHIGCRLELWKQRPLSSVLLGVWLATIWHKVPGLGNRWSNVYSKP